MTQEPENLSLVYLRRLDTKLDQVLEVLADHGRRLTSLEARVSRVQAELAAIHGDFAGQSVRIDRLEQRLDRIEHRLELREA